VLRRAVLRRAVLRRAVLRRAVLRRAVLRPPAPRRALRDGLILAGLLFTVYLFAVVAPGAQTVGFDAYAYWAVSTTDPYAVPVGQLGAFPYTPVAARIFSPAAAIDWPAFLWLWLAVLVATVGWLGGRRWWLAILAFPPVAVELYHGNIHLLLAAAIALGFRYPAAWAVVLLTKVTPGVGLLWFLVRREWRQLAIAVGVTAAIVAVSLIVDGRLWAAWFESAVAGTLRDGAAQIQIAVPLLVRLPIAAALVIWGARTDRPWTVPAAAVLALPVLWFSGLAILAAIPALGRPGLRTSRAASPARAAPQAVAGAAT
jgi:hypothetical protein